MLQAAAQPGSEAEAQQALAAAIESHEIQEMCLTHLQKFADAKDSLMLYVAILEIHIYIYVNMCVGVSVYM